MWPIELAKLGFADVGTPTPAVKHDALVSLGKHLGMFADRHILEGSIEHRITLMTRNERLRRCDELLESARRFLPLLEKVEAEEAQDAAADTNASGGEEGGAGR